MQDPHVIAIHYRVEADETVTYVCPPPVEWSTAVFDMHLADGKATFTLKVSRSITRQNRPPEIRLSNFCARGIYGCSWSTGRPRYVSCSSEWTS